MIRVGSHTHCSPFTVHVSIAVPYTYVYLIETSKYVIQLYAKTVVQSHLTIIIILWYIYVQFHLVPSVPIIDSVNAMTLSLFAFRVNITLLTDGGQSVTLYTVSVHVHAYIYNDHLSAHT